MEKKSIPELLDFSFKLFKNEVKEKVDHISTWNLKNYIKKVSELKDSSEREKFEHKMEIKLEENLRVEVEPEITKIFNWLKIKSEENDLDFEKLKSDFN